MGEITNKYVGQIQEMGITEDTTEFPRSVRVLIRLDDKPVSDDLINDPLVRFTTGIYTLGYSNGKNSVGRFKGFKYVPFYFICDLIGFNIRVRDAKHFHELADVYPEIAWVIRNTNYNDGLFDIAKAHYGIRINFCLDYVKYVKMLKEKGAGFRPLYSTQKIDDMVEKQMNKPSKNEYKDKILLSKKLALAG